MVSDVCVLSIAVTLLFTGCATQPPAVREYAPTGNYGDTQVSTVQPVPHPLWRGGTIPGSWGPHDAPPYAW